MKKNVSKTDSALLRKLRELELADHTDRGDTHARGSSKTYNSFPNDDVYEFLSSESHRSKEKQKRHGGRDAPENVTQSLRITHSDREMVENTLRSLGSVDDDDEDSRQLWQDVSDVSRVSDDPYDVQDDVEYTHAQIRPENLASKSRSKSRTASHKVPSSKVQTVGANTDRFPTQTISAEVKSQNTKLQEEFRQKQTSRNYQKMMEERQRLPVWKMKTRITDIIDKNQVVVISGDTGCGKTTQVPQFILDEALQKPEFNLNIVCTQPRRIAAISVAQRVAAERDETVGHSIGYHMRFESSMSPMTRLLYCTTGIILRRLESDPDFVESGFTHIIIDEVHERTAEGDFLLMNLQQILKKRPNLKVILMSATLNAELFSEFFNGCPQLEIPGKTFEVQQFFLEDVIDLIQYKIESSRKKKGAAARMRGRSQIISDSIPDKDLSSVQLQQRYPDCSREVIKTLSEIDMDDIDYNLIVKLLLHIVKDKHQFTSSGAILIFLPGFSEIQTLNDMLLANSEFQKASEYWIIPVHSTLTTEEQNEAFKKPTEGVTKIVIATNIAETSITIDDVVYVVDSGWMKEKRYDQAKHMENLDTVRVSKANAVQRKGRAGRVQKGVCFHLFTSHDFTFHLNDQPVPEIKRISLEQLVLKVKMMPAFRNEDVTDVLERLLEPPSTEAIDGAMTRLIDLGALDANENLTALGYYVAQLPVDVRIGKLMLFGAIFRCLDPALTIAAMLSYKSPFVTPFDPEKRKEASERKMDFAAGNSDYLTMLNAYKAWSESKQGGYRETKLFCYQNFLNMRTLQMLARYKQQFVELLSDIGFVKPGIRQRHLQRTTHRWTDGVVDVTGTEANQNAENEELISAVLTAALYPNIAHIKRSEFALLLGSKDENIFSTSGGIVKIHPSSVLFKVQNFNNHFLIYHEKIKTKQIYIRDCSVVSELSLLLFSGGSVSLESNAYSRRLLLARGWIHLNLASEKEAKLLWALREQLNQLLSDKMSNPDVNLLTNARGNKIIKCIVELISNQ